MVWQVPTDQRVKRAESTCCRRLVNQKTIALTSAVKFVATVVSNLRDVKSPARFLTSTSDPALSSQLLPRRKLWLLITSALPLVGVDIAYTCNTLQILCNDRSEIRQLYKLLNWLLIFQFTCMFLASSAYWAYRHTLNNVDHLTQLSKHEFVGVFLYDTHAFLSF